MRFADRIRSAGRRLDTASRRATRYRGMLVIVLWQAPVGPFAGPDGGVSLVFGGGLDQFVTQFGCDGPTQTASQKYRVAALEFDRDISPATRLEAVAGGITWEPQDAAYRRPGGASTGAFGQLNVRWDGQKWGIGTGLLVLPDMSQKGVADPLGYGPGYDDGSGYTFKPSLYLRVGSGEKAHARLDATPPNALGAQIPGRLGVGWNATRRDRASAFLGFATLGSSVDLLGEGMTAEATLPITTRASVRVLAHHGSGYDKTMNGFAVGGRYSFGARSPATAAVRDASR
jgi:hypothetical protein